MWKWWEAVKASREDFSREEDEEKGVRLTAAGMRTCERDGFSFGRLTLSSHTPRRNC